MPYKRTPTDEEVEALALELGLLWRKDNAVRPWLRKHAEMLTALVHDDWSWAGVAAALTRAGIIYQTGRPWHAEQLRTQIAIAQRPLKHTISPSAKNPDPLLTESDEYCGIVETSSAENAAELRMAVSERRADIRPQPIAREQISPPGLIAEPRFKPVVAKPYAPPVQLTAEERTEIDENRKRILGY